MPISIEEFSRGKLIDGSRKIVLDFLQSHRDQAFTQDEIIRAVSPDYTKESFVHFLAAMAPLQHHGLVERREISDELYYHAT